MINSLKIKFSRSFLINTTQIEETFLYHKNVIR